MNLFDCHGGPGTTEPACGACVTCLHRVIEEKDARIQRLEEALVAAAKFLDVLQTDEKELSYSEWIVALSDAGKAYREAKCKAMEAKS